MTTGHSTLCVCGEPSMTGVIHRLDGPCYVDIPKATEPCVTHRTERSVQTTLPCPWCVIDELKANNAALRLSATARDGLLDRLDHDAGLILEGAVDGLVQRSAVFRLRDTIRANRSK
jgi:hypothetical protein